MKRLSLILFVILITSCSKDDNTMLSEAEFNPPYEYSLFDGSVTADFGDLDYRIYYPEDFTGETNAIFVLKGGNGLGDERGQLFSYVEMLVENGYIVVQMNHRWAGFDINNIAKFRGEELSVISQKIYDRTLDYGDFTGTVNGSNQGSIGHSAGCIGGLLLAGTEMSHGAYYSPHIKAVYGMSPAGYLPDQFGIINDGYGAINTTAIFLILGEEEKNTNGVGDFIANDWRLQTYDAMNLNGPRFQAYAKGENTSHADINDLNSELLQYNLDNSKAFFDVYIKGENRISEIGNLSIPQGNVIDFQSKGL